MTEQPLLPCCQVLTSLTDWACG